MEQVDPQEFKNQVKQAFPRGIRAVAENFDFDFLALVGPVSANEKGQLRLLLFPDVYKNFDLTVTDVEQTEAEWLVSTTTGRWAWRQPPESVGDSYIKQMKRDNFDD